MSQLHSEPRIVPIWRGRPQIRERDFVIGLGTGAITLQREFADILESTWMGKPIAPKPTLNSLSKEATVLCYGT